MTFLRNFVQISCAFFVAITLLCPCPPANAAQTGILIPLYIYPSSPQSWAPLIAAKQAHPMLPIVAVVNVDSGPGKVLDQNYLANIERLADVGIVTLGYVHTSYARRKASELVAEMMLWKKWYSVAGIFFDEMANQPGHEAYYAAATSRAKRLGYTQVFGNPGTDTLPSYAATVDTLVIYENQHYPTLNMLSGGWHRQFDKSHFAFIAIAVPSFDPRFDKSAEPFVGWEYVTSLNVPNPYDAFPPYFAAFAAAL